MVYVIMNYYSLLLHGLSIAFQPLDRTEPSFMTVNKLASNNKKFTYTRVNAVFELNDFYSNFLNCNMQFSMDSKCTYMQDHDRELLELPNELNLLHFSNPLATGNKGI
jgi:hypothetical protein